MNNTQNKCRFCEDCFYAKRNGEGNNLTCKLCVSPTDNYCSLKITEEQLPKNDRARRTITKNTKELISRCKNDPMEFVSNCCNIRLRNYQRFMLRFLLNIKG